MSFVPGIVIPIYNHKQTIAAVVARLSDYEVPIFIVDDGSDEATQETLAAVSASQPLARLSRLRENVGKGAAVMHGLREAFAAGCTHALQVDADGQHDLSDVPRFLEQSRIRPDAVVAGCACYDESAPASRRYGRCVTHFWVWVETLSFAIGDSMCGFRVYPLAPTVALIERHRLPTRMTFDTEIIVRLFWMGLPVVNLATRVVYPQGGLSHFRMWRDNLGISWMHTRLCAGMVGRLPLLLWRKRCPPRFSALHWSRHRERGSSVGLRLTVVSYRLFGDRFARALLRPIVAWFLLSGGTARDASLDYLRRLQATRSDTPAPTWINAYRHMLAFANANLDKLAAWTGHVAPASISFENQDAFEELLASGRGAVLLGAHFGNLEMMRALAHLNGIARVNAVVYTDHARRFNAALASVAPGFELNLLQVSSLGPETAILLREKIDRGELLVIVGDRTPSADNGRVVSVEFLGTPARFPQGPFILAALLECPVYLFVCFREADGHRVHFEPFAERIDLPRGKREAAIATHAQRYADRLVELCRRTPFQWFNFFDFWANTESGPRH
ncbi:glycosyltransferase family 2 protein [Accumulibacter sp.]|uniref:glycosyltransferase family 2 protein n=1 Tax=Accumulibacter sp. TaxID=2053492 RepID=UPI0025EBDCD4|nr:glycosyltransferase family 2 protein [Accumulibacter sp.]MCM8614095.1 glycosyltransferase family 2 protein [Accumulibacter sp.]MCM8637881.1 glycosyltransferase family 2 protein [Accumulibacter sp.]MCM8641288.1 glycosyltransferase family 2 protein [Accumulibacter sp.]